MIWTDNGCKEQWYRSLVLRGDGYGGRNSSLNSEENGDGVERERERSSNLRKEGNQSSKKMGL